jgi:hypothetical protein
LVVLITQQTELGGPALSSSQLSMGGGKARSVAITVRCDNVGSSVEVRSMPMICYEILSSLPADRPRVQVKCENSLPHHGLTCCGAGKLSPTCESSHIMSTRSALNDFLAGHQGRVCHRLELRLVLDRCISSVALSSALIGVNA